MSDILRRCDRMAVCDKIHRILTRPPGADSIVPFPPLRELALQKTQPFACRAAALNDPRQTKGAHYRKTTASPEECSGKGC